jgi:hypothetical protein
VAMCVVQRSQNRHLLPLLDGVVRLGDGNDRAFADHLRCLSDLDLANTGGLCLT